MAHIPCFVRHNIAEILLNLVLSTNQSINQSINQSWLRIGISIRSGGVKLVLGTQTFPVHDLIVSLISWQLSETQ